MNYPSRKCTAIKFALALLVGVHASLAWAAQVAGTIVNLSGPLMARKADGSIRVLGLKSEVEQGDTLVSEKNTYARIRFIDNGEMTLPPGTTFKIEAFSYDAAHPEADSARFSLIKGGLRSITGLLGKRNHDKFELKTPAATIGIRGTTFVATLVTAEDSGESAPDQPAPDQSAPGQSVPGQSVPGQSASGQSASGQSASGQTASGQSASGQTASGQSASGQSAVGQTASGSPTPGQPASPHLAPGLYVQVLDGAIVLQNKGGTANFSAGQFGYTANVTKPPVIVPSNPGLRFTPPPAFSTSPNAAASSASSKNSTVDCEVR